MDKWHITDYILSNSEQINYLEINELSPTGLFIEYIKNTERGLFIKTNKIFKFFLRFDWDDIMWIYKFMKKNSKPDVMRSQSTGKTLFIF